MDQSFDMFGGFFWSKIKPPLLEKARPLFTKAGVMETTPEQMMEGISRICISNQPPIFQNTVYNNFDHALCFCQIIC